MVVTCLKCGSSEVILTIQIGVNFQFDNNGDVKLITDLGLINVEDEIYWNIEHGSEKVICECDDCGHHFTYDEWKKSLEQKGRKMWIISRAKNGLTLNKDREYLTDNEGKIIRFKTMLAAKRYLASHKLTDTDEIIMGIDFEEV